MCDEFNETFDVDDVSDFGGDIDETLDSMSLDELRDLRDTLTSDQDIGESYSGTDDLEDLAESTPDIDYGFHWDGGPTHNVEWDESDDENPPYVKVLKR